jgi:predicted dehydrogenase
MDLKPEDREIGKENFNAAVGMNRRDFLAGVVAAGAVSGAGLGAMYFGYSKVTDPVRVGVIGTGDEGSVLIGACNPDYVDVVAICDIRPSSIQRAFYGDYRSKAEPVDVRPGLMKVYGWSEAQAKDHVKVYDDYEKLLEDKNVEAVIIALPLHLHKPASIAAIQAGKHVLTEKLMGHSVTDCKLMAREAEKNKLDGLPTILATGHQRHYSVLYDNAVSLLKWGLLGEVQYIRAQWHRGNLPGNDSWQQPLPGGEDARGVVYDKISDQLASFRNKRDKMIKEGGDPKKLAWMEATIAQWEKWDSDKQIVPENWGYKPIPLDDGTRSAREELHRWRLWDRTGGGLMAELGSHQLDAASIFISALRDKYREDTGDTEDLGKKVHPLTVHAIGGMHVFPRDRQAADHVYCMFEFPGPGYDLGLPADAEESERRTRALARWGYYDPITGYPGEKGIPDYAADNNKKIVMTYASTMGNGFGGYGEIVMGSKGTLILEREQEIMLYSGSNTSSKVSVKEDAGGATLDTQESGYQTAARVEPAGPVSRGYTEEIEHWAWCIRNRAPENQPKCKPEVALGDAVIALTTKLAIDESKKGNGGYIKFKKEWFDINDDANPEAEYKKA